MTTKTKQAPHKVRILELNRVRNSTNGNPRWEVLYLTADGNRGMAKTGADAAFGYEIGNPGYRVGDDVLVTFNTAWQTIATMEAQS